MYLSLSRNAIYQFLSKLFLYPVLSPLQTELSDFLKAVERYASHFSTYSESSKLAEAAKSLSDVMSRLSLEELQSEYVKTFGHTVSKECPPYETQYGSDLIFQQTQRMADISAFYKAFGLILSDKAKERHDHISVEFEFMAFLSYKQGYAIMHHGERGVKMCVDAQKEFMKSHLIRWAPAFIATLKKKSQVGLYKDAANFTAAFLNLESKLLEVPAESLQLSELKPIHFQADDNCFSCGVKGEE